MPQACRILLQESLQADEDCPLSVTSLMDTYKMTQAVVYKTHSQASRRIYFNLPARLHTFFCVKSPPYHTSQYLPLHRSYL